MSSDCRCIRATQLDKENGRPLKQACHFGRPKSSCSATFVAVMQTSDLREGNDLASAWRVYWTCPWRIRKLRCDRHLEQTAAMVPPSVVIKDGMGGRRFARSFSWSTATERLMNAIFVVINSELVQLSLQVDCVPD